MSSYRDRFEKEVNRVGVSRIAQTLGIARNTVYNWMANANAPLNQLLALEGLGVDIVYVLTGTPRAQQDEALKAGQDVRPYGLAINDAEEVALIMTYREIDPEARATLQNMLKLIAGSGHVAPVESHPAAAKVKVPRPPRIKIMSSNLPDRPFSPPDVRGVRKKKDGAT